MSQLTLTDSQTRVLIGGLLNLKSGEIEVDYEKLAAHLGYKNRASACACWCQVYNKVKAYAQSGENGGIDDDAANSAEVSGDDETATAPPEKKPAAKKPAAKKAAAKKPAAKKGTKRSPAAKADDEDAASDQDEKKASPAKKTKVESDEDAA